MSSSPDFTDNFFDADFGTPGVVSGVPVVGIFDRKFEDFVLGESTQESHRITYRLKRTDCLTVAHGETITVGGTPFTINSIEPVYDGNTVVLVLLEG